MTKDKIVVVGAGPVGSLAAIYAAQRGHDVEVYELRGDPRDAGTIPLNFTKSINLALSERGINAMRHADVPKLLDSVLNETIPMHGRMIHSRKAGEISQESQLYDAHGRYIRAADRGMLNKSLLDALESMPNVKLYFNHKLTGVDFKNRKAWFEQRGISQQSDRTPEIEVSFDLMLGCDGAHSAVRYHLMKFTRMSYEQSYIDTLWCEFHMKPSAKGDFRISPNHLHIWPGKEFMFIAIPSLDKSFTCTLFLSASRFAHLDSHPDELISFFDQHFPGIAGDLIAKDDIKQQYKTNPHLPLITIKASPHHYGSSGVILGDAAHAMVPFYGQGMNAGLEDVRVLFETLDKHTASSQQDGKASEVRTAALEDYSAKRAPQAQAICDLAMRNYQEMRADVQSPMYLLRKNVEEKLSLWFPALDWATQYSRVSFENMGYDEVIDRARRQGRILSWWFAGLMGVSAGGVGLGAVLLWRAWKQRR